MNKVSDDSTATSVEGEMAGEPCGVRLIWLGEGNSERWPWREAGDKFFDAMATLGSRHG